MDEELNRKVDELIDRLLSDENVRNYFDDKFKELFMYGRTVISDDEIKALTDNTFMDETRIKESAFLHEGLIWYELIVEVNGMIYKENRTCDPKNYNKETIDEYRRLSFERIGIEFSKHNDIPIVKERDYPNVIS